MDTDRVPLPPPPPTTTKAVVLVTVAQPTPGPSLESHDVATFTPLRRKPLIHFPLSVTSNGLRTKIARFEELPLFKYLLPTLIATSEPALFDYDLIIGVDTGDPWYSTPGNASAMGAWWTRHWRARWPLHAVPRWVIHVYANTASRNVWAVNYAAQHAYEAGADYFYRVNDDTELHANNWSSVFATTLEAFRPFPGCGVVAPLDPSLTRTLMTMSFVGRCHFAIFGVYFPPTFHNYFSDDWITHVYVELPLSFGPAAVMSAILRNITVRHVVLPERYERMATPTQFHQQLAVDRVTLREYAEKRLSKVTVL